MIRLIRAEFGKLFSTRLWLWLLLAALSLAALFTSLTIIFGDDPDTWTRPLTSPEGQRTIFSSGLSAVAPLMMVLGAVAVTGEYRHRTVTITYLTTPHRGRVLMAKLVTYSITAAGYGTAALAVIAAVAVPWLAAKDITVSLTGGGIPGTMLGVIVAAVLYGMIGIGLGALLREQVATVVGLLIYLYVVEPIVAQIPALTGWTRFLPGKSAETLVQVTLRPDAAITAGMIEPWQGGLVLAGYGVVFMTAAMLFSVRRDVT